METVDSWSDPKISIHPVFESEGNDSKSRTLGKVLGHADNPNTTNSKVELSVGGPVGMTNGSSIGSFETEDIRTNVRARGPRTIRDGSGKPSSARNKDSGIDSSGHVKG